MNGPGLMMTHPTDDDLILRFYDDIAPVERERVDAHLMACAACRRTWDELSLTLSLIDADGVPEPAPSFERTMWARVERGLPARPERGGRPWSIRQWAPALGLAATVAAMAAGAWTWAGPASRTPGEATLAGEAAQARERVMFTALQGHFERTEMLLVELMNATVVDADEMAFERATADDLVASGRLYRATAEQAGHVQMAHMLDDLESVLVDLARSPDKLERQALESLRTRIDDDDLLFKVRAVASEIRGRQQNPTTVSEGPL